MIIIRQRQYTIQEGHYTGPKEIQKLPNALRVISKSAFAGAIAGAAAAKLSKKEKKKSVFRGLIKGFKAGIAAGIGLKILQNYVHKPMSKIKYNEVDKAIRQVFGIYSIENIPVGDTFNKRSIIEDSFSYNDKDVCLYKINFSIQDNKITMYTLGLSDSELKKVNEVLNYYCKKYYGMEYTSTLINQKVNSYSTTIVFTNYSVIANFISDLAKELKVKINLLDCDAIVRSKLIETEEKNFSFSQFSKSDIVELILKSLGNLNYGRNNKDAIGYVAIGLIIEMLSKLKKIEDEDDSDASLISGEINNRYLKKSLNKLHYIDGIHYTTNNRKASINMSIIRGNFIITAPNEDNEDIHKLDLALKTKATRKKVGKVIVFIYKIKSRQEFDFILKKLMSTKIKINIYDYN